MNPNWDQLRQWALSLDPTNQMHVALLRDCARTIGVSDNGAFDRVRQRVLGHIAAQADQTAQATYAPLGWTPPAPVQPAQPQPVATPPAATTPQAQTPTVAPVAAAPAQPAQPAAARMHPLLAALFGLTALAAVGLLVAAIILVTRDDNGNNNSAPASGGQPTTQAASPTTAGAPTQTTTLTEDRVKQIATDAAKQQTDKFATKSDLDNAIAAAVKAIQDQIKAGTVKTEQDAQKVALETINSQAKMVSSTPPAGGQVQAGLCEFPKPGDENGMPKTKIELAQDNTWFHRVFNERLFHAPDWGGADSWFASLALGPSSGGNWTSHGNPGQIVFRGTNTRITWCLGVLTNSAHKTEFMGDTNTPAAINVRIVPNSTVTVRTASGQIVTQATSDAGDITVKLPDNGVVIIAVDYKTASPTHESLVWWGPYDRSENINTVDGAK